MTTATTTITDARDRLRAASYRTGRPQYDSRCETCAHCVPAQRGSRYDRACTLHGRRARATCPVCRYDRACTLHDARVKTHGVCQQWASNKELA